jgi:hypothetical protein
MPALDFIVLAMHQAKRLLTCASDWPRNDYRQSFESRWIAWLDRDMPEVLLRGGGKLVYDRTNDRFIAYGYCQDGSDLRVALVRAGLPYPISEFERRAWDVHVDIACNFCMKQDVCAKGVCEECYRTFQTRPRTNN